MIDADVFLKKPLPFKNLCVVYPPSVEEVVDTKEFGFFVSFLEMTQEDLMDEYEDKKQFLEENGLKIPSPFEYILLNAYQDEDLSFSFKKGFNFFIHEDVTFLPEIGKILIGDVEEEMQKIENVEDLRFLTEENFFDFQNLIRKSLGHDKIESVEDLSKLHPKIAKMKKKARERDRVKAKQMAKEAPTLGTTLTSICCMGIGLTPLNIGEISYAAVSEIVSTYQKKEKYNTDCTSLLNGADAKKIGFKYWINND